MIAASARLGLPEMTLSRVAVWRRDLPIAVRAPFLQPNSGPPLADCEDSRALGIAPSVLERCSLSVIGFPGNRKSIVKPNMNIVDLKKVNRQIFHFLPKMILSCPK